MCLLIKVIEIKVDLILNQVPGQRPDRVRLRVSNERSIISSIYTRLSIDVASVDMRHVRLDDEKRFIEDIDSGLNKCLTVEANIDQAARAFRQDIAMTLFDRGVAALVPVDTTINPQQTGGFEILTLRVGEVVTWYPNHVRVSRVQRSNCAARRDYST